MNALHSRGYLMGVITLSIAALSVAMGTASAAIAGSTATEGSFAAVESPVRDGSSVGDLSSVGDRSSAATLPGRASRSRVGLPAVAAELQSRLDALAAASTGRAECETEYEGHKAQAWLNFAEYAALNDAPGAVSVMALENVRDLVSGLESHSTPANERSELPGARHVRDDLWRAVTAVKADGRRCAAPKMTAYCEVQLAWVGYEASAGGWRHVDPYVRIAEDYCATAAKAVAQVSQAAPPVVATLIPEPVRGEIAAAIPEEIELSIYVLFPHDRWRRSDILEPGEAMIAQAAKQVNGLPPNTRVMVVGHADVTGGSRYNETLSARRASSVAQALRLHGVDAARIRVSAVGSADPLVTCPQGHASASASGSSSTITGTRATAARARYWACLEPNRRVVIRLVAP